jgi:hypothetical protein
MIVWHEDFLDQATNHAKLCFFLSSTVHGVHMIDVIIECVNYHYNSVVPACLLLLLALN